MKLHLVAVYVIGSTLFLAGGCGSDSASSPTQWRSKHFDVSVLIADGWRKTHISSPGDTFDRPDEVMVAFVNDAGPYGYIIKLEKDIPLDQISMKTYLDVNRKQYISHPAYELIDETDLDFHGQKFHRFRLAVDGSKGPALMYAYIFRNGRTLVSVQLTFPSSGADVSAVSAIPKAIQEFDRGVTLRLANSPTL